MNHNKTTRSSKQKGSTLLVAMVLSAMILTVGIGAAKMLVKEVEFSADFLMSEKAYFSAESGVEIALLDLKANPVQHVENLEISIDGHAKSFLDLQNSVAEFNFDLAPSDSQKFRLLKDDQIDRGYNTVEINDFDLGVAPTGKNYQWKILCSDGSTGATINKVGTANAGISNFLSISGFTTWAEPDKKSCFLSLQNLDSTETLNFQFQNTGEMAPHKARVHAMGKAGSREKHISFDYYQKNLGALFDFVLFHTDQGF